jgi:hypothetical protein
MYRVFIYHVFKSIDSECLRDLARQFKTETTETVAFCFGIPENAESSSQLILESNWVDEEGTSDPAAAAVDYCR